MKKFKFLKVKILNLINHKIKKLIKKIEKMKLIKVYRLAKIVIKIKV